MLLTKLTAEKVYSLNFTEQQNKFCLSLQCNGVSSYIFINGVEIYKFKAKDSEINAAPLSLGNFQKIIFANTKKTELYGYIYDFSLDSDSIDVANILDIHKYLMGKII